MKYAIRINHKITGNIVFEGYFVVNLSNMLTGFYETINGFTDYTQNLIIPTDNLPLSSIDQDGFQTYTYNDVTTIFNNIYLPSWKQFNNDFEYILWDEASIIQLGLKNMYAFQQTKNLGAKSDIARYEILNKFGGVYVDTDFECLAPLNKNFLKTSF